jgi:D-aminopeptidase
MGMGDTFERMRLREMGIEIGRLKTGFDNAITDVQGVQVGHATIVRGSGGPGVEDIVRTGVTAIFPHRQVWEKPIFAGITVINGNGEFTGLAWVEESGVLSTPVCLTSTNSVGLVRDSVTAWYLDRFGMDQDDWMLPVVAETWDGWLSDIKGMHINRQDVYKALDSARPGAVAEGNVGGGTGMICHEFKGGIGTSSRVVDQEAGGYTVGVLVQANYGLRNQLRLNGIPVGRLIPVEEVPGKNQSGGGISNRLRGEDQGSIVVIMATDAPLLPVQCRRLARRAALGLGRVGSIAADSSGDFCLAFSTANKLDTASDAGQNHTMAIAAAHPDLMTPLFEAAVEAVEEAIWNALCMAETIPGILGRTGYALPLDRLRRIMTQA